MRMQLSITGMPMQNKHLITIQRGHDGSIFRSHTRASIAFIVGGPSSVALFASTRFSSTAAVGSNSVDKPSVEISAAKPHTSLGSSCPKIDGKKLKLLRFIQHFVMVLEHR